MANVQIIQRNAHLAGAVRLDFVNGREGQVAKAVLTAISNTRRGSAEAREEESTAIQWTLWGKQAENAAEYLGKGSHVNIVGRLRNNNFEKDGQTIYGMAFTAEEVDYLDTKAEGEAIRAKQAPAGEGEGRDAAKSKPATRNAAGAGAAAGAAKSASNRKAAAKVPANAELDDVPF
jgi:single stranded DNA-binding protein